MRVFECLSDEHYEQGERRVYFTIDFVGEEVLVCPVCLGDAHDVTDSLNVGQAARSRGIKVFDTALPQGWVDAMREKHDMNVVGRFVWSYDEGGLGGLPRSICEEGDRIASIILLRV